MLDNLLECNDCGTAYAPEDLIDIGTGRVDRETGHKDELWICSWCLEERADESKYAAGDQAFHEAYECEL